MPPDSERIAQAIRQLRQDLSLTQVQLANALGITPTSIYRYEAGASVPDTSALAALWQFALHNGSLAAVHFSEILADLVKPLKPLLEAFSTGQEAFVSSESMHLGADERILVLAFIKMLKAPTDRTVLRVLMVMLEPWIEQAKVEFSKQLTEQRGSSPGFDEVVPDILSSLNPVPKKGQKTPPSPLSKRKPSKKRPEPE